MSTIADRIADVKFDLHVARTEGAASDVTRISAELADLQNRAFLAQWYGEESAGGSIEKSVASGAAKIVRA